MAVKKKKLKTVSKAKIGAPKLKAFKKPKVSTIQSAKKVLLQRLNRVNQVINRFEGDIEGLLKKLVKKSERSRKDLRKNFDDILKKIRAGAIFSRANKSREELEREVRRLGEEVLGTIKEVESLLNTEKVGHLFEKARSNFTNLAEVVTENEWVLQAKKSLQKTRQEVLTLFSIPTQRDVEKLERKIIGLEKRLNNLSRKAA